MIKVTTQLTEEIFKDYYSFSLFRSKNPRLKKAITLVLMPLFSAAILLMNFLQQGSALGYIIGILGLVLDFGYVYMLRWGAPKQYQALPAALKAPQQLTFDEKAIEASCYWEEQLQQSRYEYKNVAVQETETSVYIYVAQGQALILSKEQLGGQIQEIIDLLKTKLPENQYMTCFKPVRKKEKNHVQV